MKRSSLTYLSVYTEVVKIIKANTYVVEKSVITSVLFVLENSILHDKSGSESGGRNDRQLRPSL